MSNPQMEKEEIEWSTKDPLTGEIIYLEKGILYSKDSDRFSVCSRTYQRYRSG